MCSYMRVFTVIQVLLRSIQKLLRSMISFKCIFAYNTILMTFCNCSFTRPNPSRWELTLFDRWPIEFGFIAHRSSVIEHCTHA